MSRAVRWGFSLGEFLVVIAIIAILVGLLLPATRRVRGASARMQCQNNLKQLMLAMHSYELTGRPAPDLSTGHRDGLVGRSFPPGCLGRGTAPEEQLSWMVALLPYLEQDNLFRQFDLENGYAVNLPAAQTRIKTFLCPAEDGGTGSNGAYQRRLRYDDGTHYVAMAGIGPDAAARPAGMAGNGFMGYDRVTSLAHIKDGTSNTIALMETRRSIGPWARGGSSTLRGFDPADLPLHGEGRAFGGHSGIMQAAMVDGSVRSILSTIEPHRLAAAITIAGEEAVNLD